MQPTRMSGGSASAPLRVAGSQFEVETWTNEPDSMPVQETSFVAYASRDLENLETTVPVPNGLDRMAVPKERYRQAISPQMRLVQDAHAACNRLTVLAVDSDLERMRRSETAEIEAAAREIAPPDDTLPPRATCVVVLVNPVRTCNATALLDAAAHLARASVSHPPRRGVHDTRMAFLAGNQARQYAGWRASASKKTRSTTSNGGTEVCLSWAQLQQSVSDDRDTETWQLRSEFAEVPYCKTADSYADALRTLIQQLWCSSGFLPESTRLVGSYTDTGSAEGAYTRGIVECADDFWGRLRVTAASRLSPFTQNDIGYCGHLEYSRQFVKVVPKTPEGVADLPLNHANVYHGLLLHQKGMEAESKEFCETIKGEEFAKAMASNQRAGAFGLRSPATSAEEAVCPHLLLMTADHTTLGRHVSTYGLLATPGRRLCTTNGNVLPRLTCRILPLDDEILQQAFVLPCTQRMCDPVHDVLRAPMWQAMGGWVDEYAELFGWKQPSESPVGRRRTRELLTRCTSEPRELSSEERRIGILLGMPLGCAAFSIGDVYNVVRDEGGVDPVARFLLAAGATLGSDESVEDAFMSGADAMVNALKCSREHADEVAVLKRKVQDAELRVESMENAAKHRNTTSEGEGKRRAVDTGSVANTIASIAAGPRAPRQVQLPYEHACKLLLGIGLCISTVGFHMRRQWKTVEIKTVRTVVSTACAASVDEDMLKWCKERLKFHAGNASDLQLLGEVLGRALSCTDARAAVLMWCDGTGNDGDQVTMFTVQKDGAAQAMLPMQLLSINVCENPIFVWKNETRLLANVERTRS